MGITARTVHSLTVPSGRGGKISATSCHCGLPHHQPSMSYLRLTYFDIPGRAEATRLALFIGGIAFEDKRFSFAEFAAVQARTPFKQVSVLEIDGVHHGQSTAMLRYAGKLSGLYPEDPLEAFKVDEIVMASEDTTIAIDPTVMMEDLEKQKQIRDSLWAGKLKTSLEELAENLVANPSSPYFVGDSLTIADLQVYTMVVQFESGLFEYIPTSLVVDAAPTLKKHHDLVLTHPKVKEYYASRERFGNERIVV